MFSHEAAQHVPDGTLDFIFIDANHDYEYVKQDLEVWAPKVRPGGIFSGHDYRWEGVSRAVQEYSETHSIDAYITPPTSDIWFFVMP